MKPPSAGERKKSFQLSLGVSAPAAKVTITTVVPGFRSLQFFARAIALSLISPLYVAIDKEIQARRSRR